jgi:cell division protein FtsQ
LLTRTERANHRRRKRALTHLERVRSREPEDPGWRWRPAARWAGAFLAIGALFGSGLVTAIGGLLADEPARLEAIHVGGAVRLSADQVAAATGVARGIELASVDEEAVVEQLQTHDWIEEARALRLPTGSLLVRVRERVPVALAMAGEPPALFFVEASGTPFAAVEEDSSSALPVLSAAAVATREPSAALAEAAQLARRLPDFGLPIPATVSIAAEDDPEGFALRLPGRPARVVLGREDLDRKLSLLARLLAEELPQLAAATNLDLRFADQVVLRKGETPKGVAQAAATRGRAASSKSRPSG